MSSAQSTAEKQAKDLETTFHGASHTVQDRIIALLHHLTETEIKLKDIEQVRRERLPSSKLTLSGF